jgi:hypothetical protein
MMPGATMPRRELLAGERPPLRLWHYTCRDAAPLIEQTGILRPNPGTMRSGLPEPVVWATDLEPGDVPDLDLALGIRGAHVACDRTEHRFEALDPSLFEPWTAYARRHVRAGRLDRLVRELLDTTPGGFPRHWHVAVVPVPIRRTT